MRTILFEELNQGVGMDEICLHLFIDGQKTDRSLQFDNIFQMLLIPFHAVYEMFERLVTSF